MPDRDAALDSPMLRLVQIAITAKTASDVGWPHLATAAARECKSLVDQIVIELSGACAATTVDAELADVGSAGSLPAALAKLYGRALDEEQR